MFKYPKIETLFKRDIEGTKKLIMGDWRDETVGYLSNNKWIFTEKIDGTNIRIFWNGHKVEYFGRTEKSQLPVELEKKLNELFCGDINEQIFEQVFGETNVMLFGEGFGRRIQNGGNYIPDGVDFALFDVYIPESNVWLRRSSVEDIAKAFNIRVAPVVGDGTLYDAIDYIKTKPDSTIGTAKMEGVVCRPEFEVFDRLGHRVIVKVKVRDFCE